jgi:hypothetical protein
VGTQQLDIFCYHSIASANKNISIFLVTGTDMEMMINAKLYLNIGSILDFM